MNIGDVIDSNSFMYHLVAYVTNKYTNISKILFDRSIIIPTPVLFVTVIKIIICVESMRVFQYK